MIGNTENNIQAPNNENPPEIGSVVYLGSLSVD
jgi:hypothetical protein